MSTTRDELAYQLLKRMSSRLALAECRILLLEDRRAYGLPNADRDARWDAAVANGRGT